MELNNDKQIFGPRMQEAISFATFAHADQTRKGKNIPYITHPLAVALILARVNASESVVIAGILHDTVEDTDATLNDIERQFGEEVAILVRHVTEEDKSLPWTERKKQALAHIYEMPHDALLLKSADVLHNLIELVEDYTQEGDTVFAKFNAPKDQKLKQFDLLVEALGTVWADNPLLPEISRMTDSLTDTI